MIIIGYPGVGKSITAKEDPKYLDMESSTLKVGERMIENWEMSYCKMAEAFSSCGYVVFVSCHKRIREILLRSKELVFIARPNMDIKNKWIGSLYERYDRTQLDKDFRALERAIKHFDEDIEELRSINSGFLNLVLNDVPTPENNVLMKLIQEITQE